MSRLGDDVNVFSWRFIRRTIVTGIVMLVPLGFIAYFVVTALGILKDVGEPVIEALGLQGYAGFLLLNIVAIVALLILCFLVGLLARFSLVSGPIGRLDKAMADLVPFYAMGKGILTGAIQPEETGVGKMQAALVHTAGGVRLGFEVDRGPSGEVVMFLPNVPNAQTGIAMAFPPEAIERVDLPPHRVIDMMQFFGKGLAELATEERAGVTVAEEDVSPEKPAP